MQKVNQIDKTDVERRKRQIQVNQVDQDHCEYTKTQIRLQTL